MSEIEAKLEAMGLTLPEPWTYPSGNRRGCVRVGPILYLSGHGPEPPDLPGVRQRGKLGVDVGLEEGYATARAVALLMIATLKAEVGDLDKIERVVRLFGMVNSSPDFEQFPAVIDGAFGSHPRLRKIRAHMDAKNVSSMRVLEKLGFAREGILRSNQYVKGEFGDEAIYGLLREEWSD